MQRLGIIIKSGAAIEQIGKSEVVVFDKTGTITYGSPIVEDIVILTKDGKIRQEEDDHNSINSKDSNTVINKSNNTCF